MKRIGVFPGSFDPVSSGHIHIVERAARIFDELYVAVGENSSKNCMFDLLIRMKWLEMATRHLDNIQVVSFSGLTIDFCKKINAGYMVRGVRDTADLEYERAIAETNLKLAPEIQTILLLSDPSLSSVRSTILRELIRNKTDVSKFIPHGINVYE